MFSSSRIDKRTIWDAFRVGKKLVDPDRPVFARQGRAETTFEVFFSGEAPKVPLTILNFGPVTSCLMHSIGLPRWSVPFVFNNLVQHAATGESSVEMELPAPVKLGDLPLEISDLARPRALKCVSDCYRERALLIALSEVLEIITSNCGDNVRPAKRLRPSSTADADPDKDNIPLFEAVGTEPLSPSDGSDAGKGDAATLAAAGNVLLAFDAVRQG